MTTSTIPSIRVQACNNARARGGGDYVLYWMIASRRLTWNFALDRAVEWAERLCKPLVILEALRRGFPWETDRTRRFVIDGMASNARSVENAGALYFPYIEPAAGEGKGLLAAFARRAAVVVTDEFPCFFLPRMVRAAAEQCPVLLEQVDSNGLVPLRAAANHFPTAYAFRRFLQKALPEHLPGAPKSDALRRLRLPRITSLPIEITERWRPAQLSEASTSIQRSDTPDAAAENRAEFRGGSVAAAHRLHEFLARGLKVYAGKRNDPDADATSGLSAYLHFGHISAHEVFWRIAKLEGWTPERVAVRPSGSRSGWWGMSSPAEAFLDQLVTWRELGFNCCHKRSDYDRFSSLPEWARKTLAKHENDGRPHTYSFDELDAARTDDPLWDAAQNQLVAEGRIHNYLRMLWGKKILEWTRSPHEALRIMIELNNRYALDGRGPNSYSGIFWCLGKYDRPWGPERPIYGTVRYMSSANTARKWNVKKYLVRYGVRDRAGEARS